MSIETRKHQYGKIFDHWQIRDLLGEGSNGKSAVFRLEHSDTPGIESALKVVGLIEEKGKLTELSPARREDYERAREKRYREAEKEVMLMDSLRGSPNVVDYMDHGYADWQDETGFGRDMLIRMELLRDLRSEMVKGRLFDEAEIRRLGTQICAALELCHKKGILHRDIKPENIFLNRDDAYKLGDFGVSRIVSSSGSSASTGIGTPQYWAPEQISGKYDFRVDIYSLGLVLYELANGNRLPFAQSAYVDEEDIRRRLAGEALPAPGGVSPALARTILKACACDPKDRFQSAEDFSRALNSYGTVSADPPEFPRKKLTKKLRRFAAPTAAAIVLLGLAGGVYAWLGSREHKHNWGDWQIVTPATCRQDGLETRTCKKDASHIEERVISALGHDWGNWATETAPSCETAGVEVRTCINDPAHQEQREIPALGHDWGSWITESAPGCETAGVEVRTCINDPAHQEQREIPALGHDWGAWTTETAPGCETAGVEVRTCKNDSSHQERRTISALGHDWQAATSSKPQTCSRCGAQQGSVLQPAPGPNDIKDVKNVQPPKSSSWLPTAEPRYVCATGGVAAYLFAGPSVESEKLDTVLDGTELTLLANESSHYLVKVSDGRVGWVGAGQVAKDRSLLDSLPDLAGSYWIYTKDGETGSYAIKFLTKASAAAARLSDGKKSSWSCVLSMRRLKIDGAYFVWDGEKFLSRQGYTITPDASRTYDLYA